jgi:hypothetical protein
MGIVYFRIIAYNLLMHIRNRSIFFIILIVLVSTISFRGSTAQGEPDSLTFEDTGYKVEGEFLEKFQSAADPLLVYGYPISSSIIAPDSSPSAGTQIQYFQRARFELHPENPLGERVVVSPLGVHLYDLEQLDSDPITAASNPACSFFAETGHQTCYAFLKFFDTNGGVKQFGYPISEIITLNGQLVQYFEKARFEWHPERASGKRVSLTNLGQIYLNLYEEVKDAPSDVIGSGGITNNIIKDLKVRSFPQAAVVSANGSQTIYVIVTDQKNRSVPNAQITLTLTPTGEQSRYLAMPVTDSKGVTSIVIPLKGMKIGIVEILVTVNYGSILQKETVTSFRVWY